MKRRAFLSKAAGTMAVSAVFPGFAFGKSGVSPNSKVTIAFIGGACPSI